MMAGGQPTHGDIYDRLARGEDRFASVDDKLDRIIRTQASFGAQITEIKAAMADVKETADATKDVVEAWDTARNVGRFVKWASGLLAGLIAIAAAARIAAKGWL